MDSSQDHKALPTIHIQHAVCMHALLSSESSRPVSPFPPDATARSHESFCMQATTEHGIKNFL